MKMANKELLKNLQKTYLDYVSEHPSKSAVLDSISPLLKRFNQDGLSIERQVKILRAGGLKIGYNSLKKWHLNHKDNLK